MAEGQEPEVEGILQLVGSASLSALHAEDGIELWHELASGEHAPDPEAMVLLSFGHGHSPAWAPLSFVERSLGTETVASLLSTFLHNVAPNFSFPRTRPSHDSPFANAHILDIRIAQTGEILVQLQFADGSVHKLPSGQLLLDSSGVGARLYAKALQSRLISAHDDSDDSGPSDLPVNYS